MTSFDGSTISRFYTTLWGGVNIVQPLTMVVRLLLSGCAPDERVQPVGMMQPVLGSAA
jgi:hypothetical protein